MFKLTTFAFIALALASEAAFPSTVNVIGTADIYEADGSNAGGGTAPVQIVLPANSVSMTFSVVGSVTLNGGGNYNDPDGVGAAVASSSNTGTSTLSGITAPNAGFLVGVFVPSGGVSGPAPAALNYATTSDATYLPLLDQVFFIGDGLTGDGAGSTQTFNVPVGAGTLYLGFTDAAGYNGAPGSYGDNSGSFNASYAVTTAASTAPEPSSYVLIGGGLMVLGLLRRKLA